MRIQTKENAYERIASSSFNADTHEISKAANVIMNSGEAFVKAISDTLDKNFGSVKVIFDVSCVAAAVILSLILYDMNIVGTREGTVISALLTGFVVKFYNNHLTIPVSNILKN